MKSIKRMAANITLMLVVFFIGMGIAELLSSFLLGKNPPIYTTGMTVAGVDLQHEMEILAIHEGRFEVIVPDNDNYRIAVIGDSVTMGGGLNLSQTYIPKLEQLIETRFHKDIRIMNFANGGTSTYQHLEILERFVLPNTPDLVILQMNENDYQIREDITRNTAALDRVRRLLLSKKDLSLPRWLNYKIQLYQYDVYISNMNNTVMTSNVLSPLNKFVHLLQEEDIPFILFRVPCPGDFKEYIYFDSVEKYIKDEGYPYFDLMGTTFGQLDPHAAYMSVSPDGKVLDSHPLEIGHDIIAQQLFTLIVQGGYIKEDG
ncbi:MAG: SGNH/GDSL hydrolase family protein [Candidatus Woesearchaeota archaeon]